MLAPAGRPDAVFFDAFGTLFSWAPARPPAEVVAYGLRAAGMEVSLSSVSDAVRVEMAFFRTRQAQVRTAAELAQLRQEAAVLVRDTLGGEIACPVPIETIADLLVDAFASKAFADARPAFERLQARGLRTGILSNFSCMLPMLLAEVGLDGLADPIVFSAVEGVEKPNPAIFEAAARAVASIPKRCVLIGDDLVNDVQGAQNARMPVIWINRHDEEVPEGIDSAGTLIEATDMVLDRNWHNLSLP